MLDCNRAWCSPPLAPHSVILCNMNGVSLIAAMVSLYLIWPVSYGLIFKSETRSPRKLAGVGACLVAGVLLGLSKPSEDAGAAVVADGDLAIRLALFLACTLVWGVCDSASSYVARTLHYTTVLVASTAGFALVALIAATTMAVVNSTAAPVQAGMGGGALATDVTGWWTGQALLMCANLSGVTGWYLTVLLGRIGEASSFIPLIAMHSFVAALFGVWIFGDSLGGLAVVGMCVAAGGVGLIVSAPAAVPTACPVPDTPGAEEGGASPAFAQPPLSRGIAGGSRLSLL